MNKTFEFLTMLNQTVSRSNNHYYGSGLVNLYQKDLITGKANFDNAYGRRSPVNLMKYINPLTENWYSANSVSSRDRAKAKVLGFNMLFCDVDSEGLARVSPSTSYYQVIKLIHAEKILTPTVIIRSGHGIHLIYMFKHQVPNHNPKIASYWRKTEIANLKLISRHVKGVDFKVRDMNRILRMPGSNNTKDYAKSHKLSDLKPASVLKVTGVKYDFWNLCEELVEKPEHAQRMKRYNAWKAHSEYLNSVRNQQHLFHGKKLDYTSLNLEHRIKDVLHLIALRKGHMDHYRNTALHIIGSGWLYVNRRAKYVSKSTQDDIKCFTWNLVKTANSLFEVPKRQEVMARFKRRIMASKFDINFKHNDFGKYCYSKKGIIRALGIKPSEQLHLSYLRSAQVQKTYIRNQRRVDRYNAKECRARADFEKKAQHKAKIVKTVRKLLRLRRKGYTYAKLAKLVGRSQSYVYKLVKQYRLQAKDMQSVGKLVFNLACKNIMLIDNDKDLTNLFLNQITRIRGSG